MTAAENAIPLSERIADWTSRPYRLALWFALVGVAFVSGRVWLFLLVAAFAFARGFSGRKTGGAKLAFSVGLISLAFAALHTISFQESKNLERFMMTQVPIDLSLIPDGNYAGSARGTNGDVRVAVTVKNGAIQKADLLDYREPVYAYDDVLAKLEGATTTDFADQAGFVFRNRQSLSSLQAAIEQAVAPKLAGYPEPCKLVSATFFVTSNRAGRITINAMAIVFIAILTFDFFLQPALGRGTGQSLNCYNCQACVGVCPVKMVDGDPFPMIMVLQARAGNYDRVAELAKYCVGCGKCAAKCPVGVSGPSVASSSYLLWREEIRRENRKEMALLRKLPTLDELATKEDGDEA
jgi:ferredoxin